MYKHDDDDDDVFLCLEISVWTRSLFTTSQKRFEFLTMTSTSICRVLDILTQLCAAQIHYLCFIYYFIRLAIRKFPLVIQKQCLTYCAFFLVVLSSHRKIFKGNICVLVWTPCGLRIHVFWEVAVCRRVNIFRCLEGS